MIKPLKLHLSVLLALVITAVGVIVVAIVADMAFATVVVVIAVVIAVVVLAVVESYLGPCRRQWTYQRSARALTLTYILPLNADNSDYFNALYIVSPVSAVLTSLVEMTEGYSGSDLKELCKEAAMQPIRGGHTLPPDRRTHWSKNVVRHSKKSHM